MFDGTIKFFQLYFEIEQEQVGTFAYCFFLRVMLNVLGCWLTYEGQAEHGSILTALRPRKP